MDQNKDGQVSLAEMTAGSSKYDSEADRELVQLRSLQHVMKTLSTKVRGNGTSLRPRHMRVGVCCYFFWGGVVCRVTTSSPLHLFPSALSHLQQHKHGAQGSPVAVAAAAADRTRDEATLVRNEAATAGDSGSPNRKHKEHGKQHRHVSPATLVQGTQACVDCLAVGAVVSRK